MKRIVHMAGARDKMLHIETEGAVVNIQIGLSDAEGRAVTSIQIIPDDETRSPDHEGHYWHLDGHLNNRLVRQEKK